MATSRFLAGWAAPGSGLAWPLDSFSVALPAQPRGSAEKNHLGGLALLALAGLAACGAPSCVGVARCRPAKPRPYAPVTPGALASRHQLQSLDIPAVPRLFPLGPMPLGTFPHLQQMREGKLLGWGGREFPREESDFLNDTFMPSHPMAVPRGSCSVYISSSADISSVSIQTQFRDQSTQSTVSIITAARISVFVPSSPAVPAAAGQTRC